MTGVGPRLELWAGAECTVARVGDAYRDQVVLTGHQARLDDLDRLHELGARAMRLPVLWERTAPGGLASADWSWTDERLERLRGLGIRPIVGLVHHGSGPRHTSLLHEAFAEGLAEFAQAVAQRYPWVDAYTPVNEPLTTARFSGLYGHWYPHLRSDASFVRALFNECRGTALAMEAIRAVNANAVLIQTEDFGTAFSTPRLAYQASFENLRRWLSIDLLMGRLDESHPLFAYVVHSGVTTAELGEAARAACPPDVVGVNYYVTSDRYLDERLDRYPASAHGGNGRDAYADVAAVHVRPAGLVGHRALLLEVWRRYRRPVAITEVHLGCTREEQMRWLVEAWRGANDARREGADVRAVTVWSAFGAVDWDSLLVHERGHYEPGAFDVRGPSPRPTAVAHVARELVAKDECDHPILAVPGWWRRRDRFFGDAHPPSEARPPAYARPILVTGAGGALGHYVTSSLRRRGLAHRAFTHRELDIADSAAVASALSELRPWAVINAAGYARVGASELDPARCRRDNTVGAALLARACEESGVRLMMFSSHLVFSGDATRPYVERDKVAPLNVYGRSKADGEAMVFALAPDALVIRSSGFFGPAGEGFVGHAVSRLAERCALAAATDRRLSATYLPDLVRVALDLLLDGASGVWHLVNGGASSPLELATAAAVACGLSTRSLSALAVGEHRDLRLPRYSVLGSERHGDMPSLEGALERFARERDPAIAQAGAA